MNSYRDANNANKRLKRCKLSQETAASIRERIGGEAAVMKSEENMIPPTRRREATSSASKRGEAARAKNGEARPKSTRSRESARRRKKVVEGQPLDAIPEFTAILVKVSFPQGSRAMQLRHALGLIYQDPYFMHLFPASRNPVEAPWRLAIITMLQALETLSDQQAIECVRTRTDWKYALSLPIEEQHITVEALVHFRERLQEPEIQEQVLEPIIQVCRRQKWLRGLGKQSIDSNAILETIQRINNLDDMIIILSDVLSMINCIGETMGMYEETGLEVMVKLIHSDWLTRYVYNMGSRRIPKDKKAQLALFEQVGHDTRILLEAINAEETPNFINTLPTVKALQQAWYVHYGRQA